MLRRTSQIRTLRLSFAGLLLFGGIYLWGSLSASATTTFPGRNGQVAVARSNSQGGAYVGVVTANGAVREIGGYGTFITDPSYSQDGRRIVMSYASGGPSTSLAIVNVATGGTRTIRTGRLTALFPAFLPNGRIVFHGSRYPPGGRPYHTYIVNPDGSGRRKLFNQAEIASSADGRWFLAVNERGTYFDLLLLNSRGEVVRRLLHDKAAYSFDPNFSPNGRLIVFERAVQRRNPPSAQRDLYLIRRDGTHLRRLTHGGHAADPVFSPNGDWIAFTQTREGLPGNIAALSVNHPENRLVLTDVPGARFGEPTWARRPGR